MPSPLRAPRGRTILELLLLLAVACLGTWRTPLRAADSSLHSAFLTVGPERLLRRQAIPAFLALALQQAGQLPACAQQEELSKGRKAQYVGSAKNVREAAEWYRFFVGDLVVKQAGVDGEPSAANIDECPVGLCASGRALTELVNTFIPPQRRDGISAVEAGVINKMNLLSRVNGAFDPDTIDLLQSQTTAFTLTIREILLTIKNKEGPEATARAYRKSLEKLNAYFRTVNELGGATIKDLQYLPELPLTQEELEADPYWQAERKAYTIANDPIKKFQDRNSLASKDVREGLKRFPGASILVR